MYLIRFLLLLLTVVIFLFIQAVIFQFGFNNFVSQPFNIGNVNVTHSMGIVILFSFVNKLDKKEEVDITDDDFYNQYAAKVSETLMKFLLFYLFMLIPYSML
jgi:hypothetical protein